MINKSNNSTIRTLRMQNILNIIKIFTKLHENYIYKL